RPAHRSRGRP
ncbi:hypothetical protein BN1723_020517, partial [Verticillium longisporum]